ncbi:DUF3993 domain-containing protein [Calidifontibacillus erzurumensis]|uniref:DUF3993 domain-containing protein n=1 Tax=Calidifontibacillus erzurumensis TaxID=2741433 RepID=A0A8J8GF61_9BACI|nr:DUF3993 domain-containing protein [Calidifontibacillus erzurumensis]NSL50701.1 DUF3993 domain-containing protein [Calidifontibacillus erzurumensis]
MKKKIWVLFGLLLIGQVHFIQAENSMSREDTFIFLQEAFEAQLSLGDKFYSNAEVTTILSPYFTYDYQKIFTNEQLCKEPDGIILCGTDESHYFIPYFSYDDNTKTIFEKNQIIVYEYFLPQLEGPVIWDKPHYEIITISKTPDGWRISDYQISEQKPGLS